MPPMEGRCHGETGTQGLAEGLKSHRDGKGWRPEPGMWDSQVVGKPEEKGMEPRQEEEDLRGTEGPRRWAETRHLKKAGSLGGTAAMGLSPTVQGKEPLER